MGDKTWTFRGDRELDPILKKWSKQSEKSFHVRQALRQYLSLSCSFAHVSLGLEIEQLMETNFNEIEVSLNEWG